MLKFKKYSKTKDAELNVDVTFMHPYNDKKQDRVVYCVVYEDVTYTLEERKFFWSKKKLVEGSYRRTYHYEATDLSSVVDWGEKDFEGWAELTIKKFDNQIDGWRKEGKVKKIIGD